MHSQYNTSEKLAARARLHKAYGVAPVPWFTWVAQHLPVSQGDRVLDIGCGPGWFWEEAAPILPSGLSLTLADQSQGMVEEAAMRCAALTFSHVEGQQADAVQLPFADESFDAVIAMHMLYHLPDPAVAIAECARVLKRNGIFAVTTNGADNLCALYALTTTFGGTGSEPVATHFGFDQAENLLRSCFGNVMRYDHPSSLRITDPQDVFLALTSYPPGDSAGQAELAAFRAAVDEAFSKGNGVLETQKQVALFISRKN